MDFMSNKLLYAINGNGLYIKVVGAGTAKDYKPLKETLLNIIKTPSLKHIEFDLCEVSYLDSTFIGFFLGANKVLKKNKKEEIILWNVSDDLLTLLDEVEVSSLLNIKKGNLNNELNFQEIKRDSQTEIYDILESHGHLIEACPNNKGRFSKLIDALKGAIK